MHFRRIACLLLGAWIAGSLFMMWVATEGFHTVDRVMAKPASPATKNLDAAGKERNLALLRHLVSEQNRGYFEAWERVQLVLGLLLLLALFFGTDARPAVLLFTLLLVVTVALLHWLITPQVNHYGRAIESLPATVDSPLRNRFWAFHTTYATIDVIKTAVAGLIAISLVRRRRHAGLAADELDAVDDADHRHIDR